VLEKMMSKGIPEAVPGLWVKCQRAQLPNSGVMGCVVMRLFQEVGLYMICFVTSEQIPQGMRGGGQVAVVQY